MIIKLDKLKKTDMLKYSGIRRFFSTVSIKLHAEKKAVEITLSNPKKRNPLSTETMNELYEKLIEVEKYSATEQARVNLLLLRSWSSRAKVLHFLLAMISKKSKPLKILLTFLISVEVFCFVWDQSQFPQYVQSMELQLLQVFSWQWAVISW